LLHRLGNDYQSVSLFLDADLYLPVLSKKTATTYIGVRFFIKNQIPAENYISQNYRLRILPKTENFKYA